MMPLDLRLSNRDEADAWVGAVSFEERCLGSLSTLFRSSKRRRGGRARILCYGDRATREEAAARYREANLSEMRALCQQLFDSVEVARIDPYSLHEIDDAVRDLISDSTRPIIDITCLTKVHTIGIARLCARRPDVRWAIAYTVPSNYGLTDHEGPWRDTLLLPIGEDPVLRRAGQARGVMLLGHEPTRVTVTMTELEPSAGSVVIIRSDDRPDFSRRVSDSNRELLTYLAQSSMPDAKLATGFRDDDSWQRVVLTLEDLAGLETTIKDEVERAVLDGGAPIVLFPYGPKPAIFAAAYTLAKVYQQASWALYTVRDSHSVNYCEGFEQTMWIAERNPE